MHNETHPFCKSSARLFHPEVLAGPVQDPRTFPQENVACISLSLKICHKSATLSFINMQIINLINE